MSDYEKLWNEGVEGEHKVLCPKCMVIRPYYVRIEPTDIKQLQCRAQYDKRVAYCRVCNERIHVPGFDDLNGNILDGAIIEKGFGLL